MPRPWYFTYGKYHCLAVRFGGLFLLGFFLLFFLLQLVADHLKDGDLRSVADADARVDNPRIASGAVRKFRSDFAEKLPRDSRRHNVRSRLASRLQRVTFSERDHLLRH